MSSKLKKEEQRELYDSFYKLMSSCEDANQTVALGILCSGKFTHKSILMDCFSTIEDYAGDCIYSWKKTDIELFLKAKKVFKKKGINLKITDYGE